MNNNQPAAPKPYKLVSFPKKKPELKKPQGQHKFFADKLHGRLRLYLTVQTALHVSTGVVMLGGDVGQKQVPLIKTMVTSDGEELMIPGSSLKGVIRSVYEAITNSTLGVVDGDYKKKGYYPKSHLPPPSKNNKKDLKLCPAGRVFGAMDWQGLIQFSDAVCEEVKFDVGFMPSLYGPRETYKGYFDDQKTAKGRKFYYHANRTAVSASKQRGLKVQQAFRSYKFATEIGFSNLSEAELGAFLIALGLDSKYPFALKLGAAKPVGWGTMTVEIKEALLWENGMKRYESYDAEPSLLTKERLNEFTEFARQNGLIELEQLTELAEILAWPTEREPVEGNY